MLDWKGTSNQWQISAGINFQGKVRSYNTYRGVQLLEHAMKIVERVLERKI